MVLEILCISIGNNKDIHGIVVENEEIKLGLFADDLTGFLRNDLSLKISSNSQKIMEVAQALKLTMGNQKYCYWAIALTFYKRAMSFLTIFII